MIVFGCQQCGKRFARSEATSGSVLFCECGTRNVVPWESTLPESEAPTEPVPQRASLPPADPPPAQGQLAPRLYAAPRQRDPSYCFNHQDTPPQYTCADCGERFCADCAIILQGRTRCGPCKNLYIRSLQRPPQISVPAVIAPVAAMVVGPVALLMVLAMAGAAAEGRARSSATTGTVIVIAGVAILVQLIVLLLGAVALREQEANPRLGGRSLAVTGMVAAAVCAILIGEMAVLVLHTVD
jgi:predicted  nucleic acid-binding Zn-ribbon protein